MNKLETMQNTNPVLISQKDVLSRKGFIPDVKLEQHTNYAALPLICGTVGRKKAMSKVLRLMNYLIVNLPHISLKQSNFVIPNIVITRLKLSPDQLNISDKIRKEVIL